MKIKRITAIACLLAILSSFIVSVQASYNESDKYEILTALGFFEKGSEYNAEAQMTRGDIIKALVGAVPEEKRLSYSNYSGAADVEQEDSIAEAVYNARIFGILGTEENARPDENASLEDASQLILNALGYGAAVKDNYSAYASDAGILKGLPSDSYVSLRKLATMLYNALDAGVMEVKYVGGREQLEVSGDKTYLESMLSAGKGRGRIIGTKYVGIAGAEPTGNSDVIIDYKNYLGDSVDADRYFGQTVDFYYRNNSDGTSTLLYLKPHNDDNVITFDAEDIESFDNMTYTYMGGEKQDKEKRAKIDLTTDVIYNNGNIDENFNSFVPKIGNVTLIDNDGNGTYDVAVITEYQAITVASVDMNNGVIRNLFEPEKTFTVDLFATEPTYRVIGTNGEVLKFNDLRKYFTAYVKQSPDGSFTDIIVNKAFIKGTISAVNEKNITVNGITYKLSENFARFNPNAKLMSYGLFYFDPSGRIAAFEQESDSETKSGYLIKYFIDEENSDDDYTPVGLKLITEECMSVTLFTAKTCYYINGCESRPEKTKVTYPENLISALKNAKEDDLGGGQLILYTLNQQGRIKEIEIAAPYKESITENKTLSDRGILRRLFPIKRNWNQRDGVFGSCMKLNADTVIWNIPKDISKETLFRVNKGGGQFQWNHAYSVVGFSKDIHSDYAEYVLCFSSGDSGENNGDVFLVESVSNGLDDDDNPVKMINGIYGGKRTQKILSSEFSDTEINPGDVFQIGTNQKDVVESLDKKVDINKLIPIAVGYDGAPYEHRLGYAYDTQNQNIRVSVKKPEEVTGVSDLKTVFTDKIAYGIYRFDSKRKKIEEIKYTDIKTYDEYGTNCSKVYIHCADSYGRIMLVFD